ncbi:type I-C CRISPR-associated protein Cas7/Csd2 [Dorea sp. D27]|uniref:type I-C CRISPR-associated protein Cas7/Csd2 n=1 Tax=Dorea sp. D27 TaxID=658665 RepID=UPI0006737AA7|nr:type I-C CRISPR-associated protein Cas7/Csd2 [Dorea sp. D27]KMZ53093.1 CRISPR-associated protein, Csd2 family [Dorea sp. D27]
MSSLKGKIDFVMVVSATNANPNGDPLNGNRPRENYEGYGEISDVCIKRKLRNRFQDLGEKVFVQSDDRSDDGFTSLKDRADGCEELAAEIKKGKRANKETCAEIACKEWLDVRAFGQVFAFKGNDVSLGIRGPVSIHQAVSCSPVDIISTQITKSVNSEPGKESKASDTMGMKHRIGFGLYIIKGSVNVQLAEKTGFSQEDAELLKESLKTIFENDASSARPEGSMEVCDLYWWQHADKTPAVSSAKLHRSVQVKALNERPKAYEDYKIMLNPIEGCVKAEEYHLV